ncbi:MAG: hypothetical protein GVY14_15655 [Spirochaetes bacterium]|nr:hypothetical protein [Spirochaetota bacterium]
MIDMRLTTLLVLPALLASGCVGFFPDGPIPERGITEFSNSFDSTAGDLDALFPEDFSIWTGQQLVGDANTLSLTSSRSNSPPYSLYANAEASGNPVSKADIVRGGLFFREGEEVWLQVVVYVPDKETSVDLYLLDIESTMYYGDPGRRIHVREDGTLRVESKGGFHGPSLTQGNGAIPLPKGEWVELVLAIALSTSNDGRVRLWQNSTLLIDEEARTLAESRSVIDRLQIGLTANPSAGTAEAWFDDVVVTRSPLR